MANDIKQRIVLDGEKEYSNALKEAQRNLKVLRSELKAETAELGKNATEQQKNETRLKNLQKQIREQEKVVKTYEAALQEVKDKYGDNEEAVAKWEVKLNDARTALANMKNQLVAHAENRNGVKVVKAVLPIAANAAKDLVFKVREAIPENLFCVIGSTENGRPLISVMISDDLVKNHELNAGALVREAGKLIQGGGGGQPHYATAGGKNADGLSAAVDKVIELAKL